jgi:hypothetical protein
MAPAPAPATLPEPVRRFRADYRDRCIPPGYRGGIHAFFTFGIGSLALLACLWQLEGVQTREWLVVPLAVLYANLVEYMAHRFPMHRPWPGLSLVYRRHAGQHHRFFTHAAMPLEHWQDLRAVLFPPLLVVFFFGGFALPVWLLLAWVASANVAWLFVATGLAYYLHYELLHTAYHAPAGSWPTRSRLISRLRDLHQTHHDPALMARHNFNITWPLGDWLFGTRAPRADAAEPAAGNSALH